MNRALPFFWPPFLQKGRKNEIHAPLLAASRSGAGARATAGPATARTARRSGGSRRRTRSTSRGGSAQRRGHARLSLDERQHGEHERERDVRLALNAR